MDNYLIEIEINNTKETVNILAVSHYHAIELLMYKHEWYKKQSDRTKYKLVK